MEKLVMTLRKELYKYALKLTGNISDADDLIQETCLRMLNYGGRYAETPLTDQRKIAGMTMRNLFIDKERRKKVRPRIVSDLYPMRASDNTDPMERAVAKRIVEKVRKCDDNDIRAALLLAQGYKTSEIAKALKTTNSAVSGRVRAGRTKLRKMFAAELN